MTDQSDDVLAEAVRLLDGLRRRARVPGGGRAEDVWGRAVREEPPHPAAECRYCPLCRVMAAARASGGDVSGHLLDAARSLSAAAREFLDGLERSRPPRTGTGRREGSGGDPADIARAEGP
jgi:hypothetical protein